MKDIDNLFINTVHDKTFTKISINNTYLVIYVTQETIVYFTSMISSEIEFHPINLNFYYVQFLDEYIHVIDNNTNTICKFNTYKKSTEICASLHLVNNNNYILLHLKDAFSDDIFRVVLNLKGQIQSKENVDD